MMSVGVAVVWARAVLGTSTPRVRRAATFGLVGATAVALQWAIGMYYQYFIPQPSIPPWLLVLGWVQGPLWGITLLAWPAARLSRESWRYLAIDIAILVVAVALVVWYYRFGASGLTSSYSFLEREGGWITAVVILLGVTVAALRGSPPESELPFHLLITALVLTYTSNFVLTVVEFGQAFGNQLAVVLLLLSTACSLAAAEALRLGWRRPGRLGLARTASPIPWVAVMAVAFLLLQIGIQQRSTGFGIVVIGAVVLTGFLLIRQALTMRDNARLVAERAQLETDTRIAALVRHTSDVILIVDEGFRIRFASPSVEALWATNPDQILGTRVADLVEPAQRAEVHRVLSDRVAHPGQSIAVRWRVTAPDGGARLVEAVITSLLHAPSVNGVVLTLRDLTERAHLEEQLHQAQKMEAVGQLAGGIAHDFNNLLTTVLGHSELGLESLEPGHAVRADFEQIKKAAELAASLTRQLLAFSRKQIVEPRLIDVAVSLDQVAKLLRRLIEEHVTTEVRVAPDVGWVRMDPSQLEQVVLNLAVNARDAMPRGGTLTIAARNQRVTTAIVTAVIPVPPGEYLVVQVGDTGVGMDAATQARIFEPFFTTKPPGRGTGLGLASVYGIVKQNRGGLVLESTPGRGSTFSVYLPRAELAAVSPVDEDVMTGRPGASTATILLVEDEPWVRDMAQKVLVKEGYRVLVAADAAEARVLAADLSLQIDLMVSDIVMPGLSGPRLAEELRRDRPRMRVLFITGYPGGEMAEDLPSEDHVLRKPFTPFSLLDHVRLALEPHGESTAERPIQ